MSDRARRKFQKELNSGAVSLVLLAILEKKDQPLYGYQIARQLSASCGEQLPMNQAAIYPVLRSLEKQGLLSSSMKPSETGPPRKYYRLTAAGRRSLPQWTEAWEQTTRFVNDVLESPDEYAAGSSRQSVSGTAGKTAEAKIRRGS